jgi:LuxR family transcriptional regulator, maltose regulon positive regulatory protein
MPSTSPHRAFQAHSWVVSLAHLGLALASAATGRLDEAERDALRGERLRRSPQPTIGHAHALLVLAHVRVARSRLAPAARDLERAQRAVAEFPDAGRLPVIAATVARELARTRATNRSGRPIEAPSPAELAVLRGLAAGLSRREIGDQLYISLNTVKTDTRELYRKLGATSQAEAVARAEALGLLEPAQSPGCSWARAAQLAPWNRHAAVNVSRALPPRCRGRTRSPIRLGV